MRKDPILLYFVDADCDGRRPLRKGELFPVQDKPTIRQYAPNYGLEVPDDVVTSRLPYVKVFDAETRELEAEILAERLTYDEAVARRARMRKAA